MPQLLQKPPLGGVYCIAWILQGPFDIASKLNWRLFYAGENGVRERFLDMWEYLAREHPCICWLQKMPSAPLLHMRFMDSPGTTWCTRGGVD